MIWLLRVMREISRGRRLSSYGFPCKLDSASEDLLDLEARARCYYSSEDAMATARGLLNRVDPIGCADLDYSNSNQNRRNPTTQNCTAERKEAFALQRAAYGQHYDATATELQPTTAPFAIKVVP